MDSNKILFDPAGAKIGHNQVGQDQVASMYVHEVYQ